METILGGGGRINIKQTNKHFRLHCMEDATVSGLRNSAAKGHILMCLF